MDVLFALLGLYRNYVGLRVRRMLAATALLWSRLFNVGSGGHHSFLHLVGSPFKFADSPEEDDSGTASRH
jgi:hypothetical protein